MSPSRTGCASCWPGSGPRFGGRRFLSPCRRQQSWRVGHVRLDTERHEVFLDNAPLKLTLKEFELLAALLENAGRVLTRERLIDRVWGPSYVGDTKTLDVHIKRLRAKLEPHPSTPVSIITIRGLGYKFEPPVRAGAPA